MLAKDIMNKNFPTVSATSLIMEVSDILHNQNISCVPVINTYGIVEGVISEKELFSQDYKIHLPTYINLMKKTDFVDGTKDLPYVAEKILRTTASEIMNKSTFFALPDWSFEQLVAKMLEFNLDTVPVVNHSNEFLGVITRNDIFKKITGKEPGMGDRKNTERYVDQELHFIEKDFFSKFAYVTKFRVNTWMTTAIILFIIGFIIGIIYVANPDVFFNQ